MAQAAGGDEKESVRNYFNTAGFERWNKIYGTTSVCGTSACTPPALCPAVGPAEVGFIVSVI
jgi:hypothetical protein